MLTLLGCLARELLCLLTLQNKESFKGPSQPSQHICRSGGNKRQLCIGKKEEFERCSFFYNSSKFNSTNCALI